MKNVVRAFVIVFLGIGLLSCKIGDDQPERELFEFLQPVSISPLKKEYNVGDIFFLSVEVPSKIFDDLKTGNQISVGNAIFVVQTRMDIFNAEPLPNDTSLFDLIIQNGTAEEDENFSQTGEARLSYGCPESTYSLNIGYQLKAAGNYVLVLNDLEALSLITFTDDSDCTIHNSIPPSDADQAFIRYLFEGTDVNTDVFEEVRQNSNEPNVGYYESLLANKFAIFLKVR